MFGETAAATLFHSMHQRTTIPAFKEAFRCIGQDEARHLGICLALLQKVMPELTDEDKERVTKQLRAGFVFLSGVLYEPPKDFWSCRDLRAGAPPARGCRARGRPRRAHAR